MVQKQWDKLIIETETIQPDVLDYISYYLMDQGALGTEIKYAQYYLENHPNLFGEIVEPLSTAYLNHPVQVVGYFKNQPKTSAILAHFKAIFPDYTWTAEVVKQVEEDWQRNWMAYYQVEYITRHTVVVPAWTDFQQTSDQQAIYLDPGVAFGTGNHPTTQLGAQGLEIVMRGGEKVIDVGTGSGILAFIAASLGASQVLGLDLDPQAINAAQDNLKLQSKNVNIAKLIDNKQLTFKRNDLLKGIEMKADVIVANIVPHILLDLLADAVEQLVPGGHLILGGILTDKAHQIETGLGKFPFQIIQISQRGDWLSYIVQKVVEE